MQLHCKLINKNEQTSKIYLRNQKQEKQINGVWHKKNQNFSVQKGIEIYALGI